MDFMTALSALMLSILAGALLAILLGSICLLTDWFYAIKPERRYTMMLTAWALFSLIAFTAMNSQKLFW